MGAEIVVFPEMFSNGYARLDPDDEPAIRHWHESAVVPEGEFIASFIKAAQANCLYVVASFLEAGSPRPFNTAWLIAPDGSIVLRHRKVHICDFDSPEIFCARGSGFATATIDTRSGPLTLGLMICMDREYPEAARALSQAGAEIALVPNACLLATDPEIGDVRIAQTRGRAFETVMAIAVANYPAPRYDGHSFAVGPKGEVLAMAESSEALLLADFDLEAIRATRAEEQFRLRSN
jgi:predicted amidohydrolase